MQVLMGTSVLQNMTDAMIYLGEYAYGCNEQLSSKIIALVSFRDSLTAFNHKSLPKAGVPHNLLRKLTLKQLKDTVIKAIKQFEVRIGSGRGKPNLVLYNVLQVLECGLDPSGWSS